MASIRARRTKQGVTWQVMFRSAGKQMGESFLNEHDALEFKKLVEELGPTTALRILAAHHADENDAHTVETWMRTYLDKESGILTGITDTTREGYDAINRKAILPYLGKYPLTALVGSDVIGSWIAWLERQPSKQRKGATLATKTILNYQGLLSTALDAAVERGHIAKNPAKGARVTEGITREPVFLSNEQFQAILAHIPDHYKPLTKFLVGTGMRWSEATALTWADINTETDPAVARINKAWNRVNNRYIIGPVKTKKSKRTVSLWGNLVDDLGERGAPASLVFTAKQGGRVHHSKYRERVWLPAIKAAYKAGKLTELPRIHDLRHTHASWLVAAGVPLPFVQARLGHESIKTTIDTYTHIAPDAHIQMANVMEATMVGTLAPVSAAIGQAEPEAIEAELEPAP